MPMRIPLTTFRFTGSQTIAVLVGQEQKVFYIHEDALLREASSLASRYVKTVEGSITQIKLYLPFAKPIAFEILVDYLYQENFSSKSSLHPSTATINPFISAWHLAGRLDMEDAKNAIMRRIRNVIYSLDVMYTFSGGFSGAQLVRGALAKLQDIKPDRNHQVRNFLVDRLAFDMFNKSTSLFTGEPAKLNSAIGEIFEKGGPIATDVLTRYFLIKSSPDTMIASDPARLLGCHSHDRCPGYTSRMCLCPNFSDGLFGSKAERRPDATTPRLFQFGNVSGASTPAQTGSETAKNAQSNSSFNQGLFGTTLYGSGQQQKDATTSSQQSNPDTTSQARKPLFSFGQGSSTATNDASVPASTASTKTNSQPFGTGLFGQKLGTS